jgi:hypothetical protein
LVGLGLCGDAFDEHVGHELVDRAVVAVGAHPSRLMVQRLPRRDCLFGW